MKGPAFVKVLKDLGFEKVKTHMAVLDDADQMIIEVRLGAAGYQKAATQAGGASQTMPLRKKKKSGAAADEDAPAAATATEDEASASPIRKKRIAKKSPLRRKEASEPAEAPAEAPEIEAGEPGPAEPSPEEQGAEVETGAAAEVSGVAAAEPPIVSEPEQRELEDTTAEEAVEPETTGAVETEPETEGTTETVGATEVEELGDESEPSEEAEVEPEPAESRAEAEPSAEATATEEEEETPEESIRRLPKPEAKAKVLGRIDLSEQTISDAKARSAGGPRNPANVDRSLRRAALDQIRSRTGSSLPGRRTGPGGGGRGGPRGGPGRGLGRGTAARKRGGRRAQIDPLAPPPGVDPDKLVQVEVPVTVKRLSEALGHKVQQLMLVLLRLGVHATINSFLDKEQVELVALELSRNVEVSEAREAEDEFEQQIEEQIRAQAEEAQTPRPPIVTFMGHVDHGKTTLVDALRGSDIIKGEAGGITQHVGAYRVQRDGHTVVILDTPGHAAFTAMRARGANLTDIVVLIVAADDGVMPQTEEALNHAKAAEVPIVVAINKCDKPDANPMRVRQQLSALGLQPEEWGGNVQFVELSALTGEGIDELVEKISLEAMVLELSASFDTLASGTVIEAKQTPAQGNVVSLMVTDGTLHRGDLVLCGHGTGRIRVILDDRGEQIDEARPGTPVEVLGLPELPAPGDRFHALKDQKMAKEVASGRAQKIRKLEIASKSQARKEDIRRQLESKKIEEVRLIVKADFMGSLEPIRQSLEELSTDEVRVRILHSALGGISESDVVLADASDALIVGFNSHPDEKARQLADQSGVTIRFYNVIYELIDDCRLLLEGLLAPEQHEEVRGHAEVRRVFKSSKVGTIAGCFVLDGIINRNHLARVKRDGEVIHTSRIASLKREKDDVRDVREGFECGIRVEGLNDFREGDIIEVFEIVEVKRTLGDPA